MFMVLEAYLFGDIFIQIIMWIFVLVEAKKNGANLKG